MIRIYIIQDTLKQNKSVRQNTIKQLFDYSAFKNKAHGDSASHVNTVYFHPVKTENADTASSCHRNKIADVTFYDSTKHYYQN